MMEPDISHIAKTSCCIRFEIVICPVKQKAALVAQSSDLNMVKCSQSCSGRDQNRSFTNKIDLRLTCNIVQFGIIVVAMEAGNRKITVDGECHILRNLNFGINTVVIPGITIVTGRNRNRNTISGIHNHRTGD